MAEPVQERIREAVRLREAGDTEAARAHCRTGRADLDAPDHEQYGESIRRAFSDYAAEHPDAT